MLPSEHMGHSQIRGTSQVAQNVGALPTLLVVQPPQLQRKPEIWPFDVHENVEILGREEDGRIKLHGLRLELSEIETAIGACECLSTAQRIAAAKVEIHGKPTLAAFIQLPAKDGEVLAALSSSILGEPSDRFRTKTEQSSTAPKLSSFHRA